MDPGYFFIGGAPKSGTTWLQRSLDLHPEIVCNGEGHLHECVVQPIVEMLAQYDKKLTAVAQIVYEGEPFYPRLTRQDQIEISRQVVAWLMARRNKPGARLIGDKTPSNAKIVEDLKTLFPEMKFIGILRDPRDVAASRLGHALRQGHPEAGQPGSAGYYKVIEVAARDWNLTAKRAGEFCDKSPEQGLIVRYEDLRADPHSEFRRILVFLDVDASDHQVGEIVERTRFEVFSGGRPAGVESRTSFYRKGVTGDWPNVLTDEALQVVEAECGETMLWAGYEPAQSRDGRRTG
jgi:hypothetical protein